MAVTKTFDGSLKAEPGIIVLSFTSSPETSHLSLPISGISVSLKGGTWKS